MKLQTPVTDEKCRTGISYEDKIMTLGSCFTDNIGRLLADLGFDICVNPFGTLYNPISILQSIEMLLSDRHFNEEDCVEMGACAGLICSFSHHTSFARVDKTSFLENANTALDNARASMKASNKIIITLGTSWCFRNNTTGRVVSNCLKRPAYEFTRERLSANEVTDALNRIITICNNSKEYRSKDFIFTVSPIRHFKDGAHGNQLSKAALLLGIDDIICSHPEADYFPAYEIMMDELRDYRFYSEDMCHPTQQAIEYICERFLNWALQASEHDTLEKNIKNLKQGRHINKHLTSAK